MKDEVDIVSLPSASNVGPVEKVLADFYSRRAQQSTTLVISLAKVAWIDLPAMALLLAIHRARHVLGRVTLLELPKDPVSRNSVLIYMHTWRFFHCAAELAGLD